MNTGSQQEWTPLNLLDIQLPGGTIISCKCIADRDTAISVHNAAFIAEREKVENLHKILGRKRVTIKELREQIEQAEEQLRNLTEAHIIQKKIDDDKLVSALAAIRDCKTELEVLKYNITNKQWEFAKANVKSADRRLEVDLSLLHEHVRKEQQPLLDALVKIRVQLDMEPQRLPLVERLQKYIADALAKVKQ